MNSPDTFPHPHRGERAREPGAPETFKVPAGEAPDGRLVRARQASPDVRYRCPGCHTALLLRKGAIRSPHFAHKAHGCCSPETALHQGAKRWLAQILTRSAKGKHRGAPRIRVSCSGHARAHGEEPAWRCPGEAWFSLADFAYDEVALERTLADGLRPDLLLLRQGVPALAIEVLVTHAVDAAKAGRLPCPWVELEATRVLTSPRRWHPLQGRHPWTGPCRRCTTLAAVNPDELSEVTDPGDLLAQMAASLFQLKLTAWRSAPKRLRPAICWRCPACKKMNARALKRDALTGIWPASFLGPPIRPGVMLEDATGPAMAITFAFPRNPRRPRAVIPLACAPWPCLCVTPDLDNPHRLALNGTNRPLAFACPGCGADCVGLYPNPSVPCRPEEAPP